MPIKSTEIDYKFRLHQPEDELPQWNDGTSILYLLQGRGTVLIEGERFENRIGEDDIFVINDFQLFHLSLEKNSYALSLEISPHLFAKMAPEYSGYEIDCKSYLYPENQQHYFNIIRKNLAIAFQLHNKQPEDRQIQVRSRIAVLLADLLEYFGKSTADGTPHTARRRLKEIVRQINVHYDKPLTLQSLAEEHHISVSYLSRLFQKELGMTYTDYLTSVRLLHAKKKISGDSTFTDIALSVGFPSSNAMIDAFRKDTGLTPGEYRESMREASKSVHILAPHPTISFERLFAYTQKEPAGDSGSLHGETRSVNVVLPEKPKRLFHKWKRILNGGYAVEILTYEVRQQLELIQKRIGFRYLRFHGIFDDDMQVYHESPQGEPFFNFVKINSLIDLILELGFTPFIPLSYTPSLLTQDSPPLFRGISRPAMPNHLGKWTQLVKALLNNLMTRYGENQVRTWMFSFYSSMDMANLGFFTKEEYLATYAATYRAIKQVDSQLLFCGPGTALGEFENLTVFIDFCRDNRCLPDMLCFHCYHSMVTGDREEGLRLEQKDEAFPMATSSNPDFLAYEIRRLEKTLAAWKISDIPYFLDEWSNTIWQRDLTNDTSYKSAFLFKNVLENYDALSGMGYWSASDYLSELPASRDIFHGGFGLLTRNGIPKSAFRAYELLAMMGNAFIKRGEGYFITQSTGEIQIFLYSYTHYDTLYRYRHTQTISQTKRYKVFKQKDNEIFTFRFQNLPHQRYRVDVYSIGPQGGSTFDAWVSMGAPTHTTTELAAILERESYPVFHTHTMDTAVDDTLRIPMVPHQVRCIVMKPI